MGGELERSCEGAVLIGCAWGRGARRTGGFNVVIFETDKLMWKLSFCIKENDDKSIISGIPKKWACNLYGKRLITLMYV